MEIHFDWDTVLEKATVDHFSIVCVGRLWFGYWGRANYRYKYSQRGWRWCAKTTVVSHSNLREKNRLRTWNARSMNQGKLDIVKREMERIDVNLLGVSEMKWTGMGQLQVGQSRGVLFWRRCSETKRCGFHVCRRNTKMCFGIQPCMWQNSNYTSAMHASKEDCLASTLQHLQRKKKKWNSSMRRHST